VRINPRIKVENLKSAHGQHAAFQIMNSENEISSDKRIYIYDCQSARKTNPLSASKIDPSLCVEIRD